MNFYRKVATLVQAYCNTRSKIHAFTDITEHEQSLRKNMEEFRKQIHALVREHCPSGSGFDNGTHLDLDHSTPTRLVFTTMFHHMMEGVYIRWTDHSIVVTADLLGVNVKVSGQNLNEIKDHISVTFGELEHVEI